MSYVRPDSDFVFFFIAINNNENFDPGTQNNILTLQEAEQNSVNSARLL